VSRHLAIDWDQRSLRIVAATLRAGTIRIEKAVSLQEQESPNIVEAEALGQHLRERLKSAGIAPAPVLACVARDRVILREIRYPAVAAAEEPAVIRFQVMKELSDSPDEVIIDYVPLGEAAPGEERRALVLTIRRELLAAYQVLCKAAGLKLDALTPRPFGALACLRESMRKWQGSGALAELSAGSSSQAAVALLTSADGWSEFCLVRDDTILVARSLPAGPALPAEVRRNIAVYTAQSPRHTITALYLAGNGEAAELQESLRQALDIPVRTFDPFLDADVAALPGEGRGAFAGAVGLLRAQAVGPALPINFVSPKKPQAARDPNKRWLTVAAGLAACLLIGVVSYCYAQLAALDGELAYQKSVKESLEKQKPVIDQEVLRLEAYQLWRHGNINWLDELYDLDVLMPDHTKMLLSELVGDAMAVSKEKLFAKLTLKGGTITNEDLADLIERMRQDKEHYVPFGKVPGHQQQKDFPAFAMQFTADIQVLHQPPEKYSRHLPDSVVQLAQSAAPRWIGKTQETVYHRPVTSGGLKKVAQWDQGTHVQKDSAPSTRPGTYYNPARPTYPPANAPASPPVRSESQNRFQDFMREAYERRSAMQGATAVEKPVNTLDKPLRMTAPVPATAPAAPPPNEKRKKK
jgi:Tfp pilus assembly PilM family ATPase